MERETFRAEAVTETNLNSAEMDLAEIDESRLGTIGGGSAEVCPY